MILIIVAIGGIAAFLIGMVLLALYFNSNRRKHQYENEPVVYGSLVQCSNCGYMNPMDTAACLNCRQPLPQHYPAQPNPDYLYAATSSPVGYYQPRPPDFSAPVESPPAPVTYQPAPAPIEQTVPVSEAPSGIPHAWLEGVGGPMMGHRAALTQADTLVGRSTSCHVQVYDPKVSRRHFLIRYANGGFFLQDQQSSRGTRVNGEKVMARRLKDGDHIEIGDSGMVFRCE